MQFLFADRALDIERRELTRGSELISVGPQVFDLLVFLVQNRERVISKDDLLAAVWFGRIVSESTLTSHINAARKAIGDSGDEQRLIRTIARKGFRFVGEVRERQASAGGVPSARSVEDAGGQNVESIAATKPAPTLTLPDKPSIAVLPFQNLSGDPEQDYFADGMVEDIIIALSRMRWLFVIARNSSFTYKGRAVDVKQVGRELGVRYVMEGSVRKAANRVRITGKLIDTSTGANLWADRFEGTIDDVFDLQDRVTTSVAGAIAPKLELAEIERAKRKPTESLDAYDYFLRGMSNAYRRTREANTEALHLFSRAIDLDADFGAAYGMAAWCYAWRKMNGWMTDRAQEIAEAARLARRAVESGRDDAIALTRGGATLAFVFHDLEGGIAYVDRALLLNPNLATSWYISGWLRAYRGESDVAIEHQARAIRLSPLDPTLGHMQAGMGFAHMLAGRYEEASSWAEKAFWDQSNYLPAASVAAASNALAEQLEEAKRAMERVRQIDPLLRMCNLKDWFPIRRPEHFAKFAEGLGNAGVAD